MGFSSVYMVCTYILWRATRSTYIPILNLETRPFLFSLVFTLIFQETLIVLHNEMHQSSFARRDMFTFWTYVCMYILKLVIQYSSFGRTFWPSWTIENWWLYICFSYQTCHQSYISSDIYWKLFPGNARNKTLKRHIQSCRNWTMYFF
jgi:hypothetical protein